LFLYADVFQSTVLSSSQAKVPILVYSYLHLGVKRSECNAICRMSFKFDYKIKIVRIGYKSPDSSVG
jgi:hypothetical protein